MMHDAGCRMHDGGRRPSVEDDLWWKMTFGGRRPSVEDDLQRKTNLGGRRPLVEEDLRWKTTFRGRRPSTYQLVSIQLCIILYIHLIFHNFVSLYNSECCISLLKYAWQLNGSISLFNTFISFCYKK